MDDKEILARTIWGEARGEIRDGKIAVANVILNRVAAKKPRWGLTIRDVCLKPYQFSCWLQSDPNFSKLKTVDETNATYKGCLEIADDAINGLMVDNTVGACFYKVKGSPAKWANGKTPCVTIGHHEFYNDVD